MPFILILAISLALHSSASAGARNGYRLVFFDNSPATSEETKKIFGAYFNSQLAPSVYQCEAKSRFIDIDLAYLHRLPKSLTPELIRHSVTQDGKALRDLRKKLRRFRDSEIEHGFDGLLIFRNDGKSFELITIGAVQDGYKRSAKLAHNNIRLTPEILKRLFCESTAELDFAYQGD